VSGLIRPITLQDNLGDDLTLSTDGPFVFPGKIDAHSAYSVTVLTPPPGLMCTVAGNTGTVTADVNGVSIICSVDRGSYFVPFNATGQYTNNSPIYIGPWPPPTNGANALIAVATNNLGAPPTTIATGLTKTIGVTQKLMLDSHGTITAGALSTLVYATEAATGGDHLWAVDLSGGSNLTPRQLSNLTVPFIGLLACSKLEVYKNFNDPDSAFFILGLPPDSQNLCGSGAASFNNIMIRLSDSSSATPRPLPSFPHRLLPLYNPTGALAGFVTVDATNHLIFYADETFTNPRVLLGNVTDFSPIQAGGVSTLAGISSTPSAALIVTYASDFSERLYHVDYR